MPEIPEDIINRVEETEGLRFKKKPRLIYNNVEYGQNHSRTVVDPEGRVVDVPRASVSINKSLRDGRPVYYPQHDRTITGTDKLIMFHELRENVRMQHDPIGNRSVRGEDGAAHKNSIARQHDDTVWAREHGYVKDVPNDPKHLNIRDAAPHSQYGSKPYSRVVNDKKRVETEAKQRGCCPQKRSSDMFGVMPFKPLSFNSKATNFNFNSKAMDFGFGNTHKQSKRKNLLGFDF